MLKYCNERRSIAHGFESICPGNLTVASAVLLFVLPSTTKYVTALGMEIVILSINTYIELNALLISCSFYMV